MQIRKNESELVKKIFIITAVFYLIMNGYRMTHNMYSFDSLLMIYQNDYAWQIALGRYIIPILIMLRGTICNPWLISVITIIWNSLTVYFICKMFNIDDAFRISLVGGIVVCNPTTISMNAAYLMDVDFYALSCLMAVVCVYFYKESICVYRSGKEKGNRRKCIFLSICSIIALAVSMGIYQAYICVAIGLIMMLFLVDSTKNADVKHVLRQLLYIVAIMVVGALMYYDGWKILQKIFNIWTANTYNGLDSVGDYSETSILGEIVECYRRVADFFVTPDVFSSLKYSGKALNVFWRYIIVICNIFVMIYSIISLYIQDKKNKVNVVNVIFQMLILIVFPFGINIVCFISKGMEHTLMIFAFNLVYILAVVLFRTDIKKVIVIPFALVIWTNIVSANQVYLKKELLYEAAGSLLTRVVSDVEDVEGYIPGETKVALYGTFDFAPNIPELVGFEDVICYGMSKTGLSYVDLDYSYMKYILCVDMNLTRVDKDDNEMMKVVNEMPYYPEKGSVAFVGDTVVVKVADY